MSLLKKYFLLVLVNFKVVMVSPLSKYIGV